MPWIYRAYGVWKVDSQAMRWTVVLGLSLIITGCGLVPGIPCTDEPMEGEPFWCNTHRLRNQYQDDYCPDILPPSNWVDPETGICFGVVANLNIYHGSDECVRGNGGILHTLDYDSDTMDMLIALGADPLSLTPGIQCCYDSKTHELTDSGSFDFQTPPNPMAFLFSPLKAFLAAIRHIAVDIWPFGETWGYQFVSPDHKPL